MTKPGVTAARAWATTYFGARVACDQVDVIQCRISRFGVWEPDVSHVIERNLDRGDVFIDIGANIGYDSLLGASLVGDAGAVVAIEPVPSTFELLRANIAANPSATNVRTVNVAVSNRRETLSLYEFGPRNIGATTTVPTRRCWCDGRTAPAEFGRPAGTATALPLGDILTAEEMSRTRLIKIDVEGAEAPIIADILDHVGEYPPSMDLVVEADPELADWADLLARLAAAGFSAWLITNRYEPAWYEQWREFTPLQRIDEPPAEQVDMLLTRCGGRPPCG
jgi:FkbM family methyltransferase